MNGQVLVMPPPQGAHTSIRSWIWIIAAGVPMRDDLHLPSVLSLLTRITAYWRACQALLLRFVEGCCWTKAVAEAQGP